MRAVQTELMAEFPHMPWLAGLGAVQRSAQLVGRAKFGDDKGLDVEFDEIVKASQPNVKDLVNYNWVCAYSILSKTGPADRREDRAARAVGLLHDLLQGTYFRNPVNADHLDKDEDLDPIRDRPDYRAFRQKVRELSAKK
jgi:hypothetical protein